MPGITVNLNGQTAAGPALSRTLVSDSEGEYEFLIPPGSYVIGFNAADPDFPAGLTRLTTPATYSVSVNGGLELEGFNFGRDSGGALGGMVFDDVDGNGVKAAGEAALANVVVEWYDSTGVTLFDAQITAADGTYRFDGVADAAYVVKVRADTLPAQFDPIPTVDPTLPLDGNGNATVTNGSTLLTLNYGYRLLGGSLAGTIVFGDGAPNVQPIHVDDLASLLLLALDTSQPWGGATITVGGADVVSTETLLRRLRADASSDVRFKHVAVDPLRALLALVEPVLLPLLPFTAGQLTSFVNRSDAGAPAPLLTTLLARLSPPLRGLDAMLPADESRGN